MQDPHEPQNGSQIAIQTTPSPEAAQDSVAHVRGHILFTFGVILLLALAWKLSKEIEILYVSALFAVVLMPVVNSISKLNLRGYRPSRTISIVILIAGFNSLLYLRPSAGSQRSPRVLHRTAQARA